MRQSKTKAHPLGAGGTDRDELCSTRVVRARGQRPVRQRSECLCSLSLSFLTHKTGCDKHCWKEGDEAEGWPQGQVLNLQPGLDTTSFQSRMRREGWAGLHDANMVGNEQRPPGVRQVGSSERKPGRGLLGAHKGLRPASPWRSRPPGCSGCPGGPRLCPLPSLGQTQCKRLQEAFPNALDTTGPPRPSASCYPSTQHPSASLHSPLLAWKLWEGGRPEHKRGVG